MEQPTTAVPEPSVPRRSLVLPAALLVLALFVAGLFLGVRYLVDALTVRPLFGRMNTSHLVITPSPNVLLAVRDLGRLETASFHMERVVELSDQQQRLWGLVEARDALMLVAVGELTAGVDLAQLRGSDVQVDWPSRRVRIELPPAELFMVALDNQRTQVRSRNTDLLAARNEQLESQARAEAERSMRAGALEAGILTRAGHGAQRELGALLHALGFSQVEVVVRGLPAGESAR